MKNLIICALFDASEKLNMIIPNDKTKIVMKSISIFDVSPLNLTAFMEDNNIPNNARFDGNDNGYDAWNDITLSWEVNVAMSSSEILKLRQKRFTGVAFKFVYDVLTKNNYKRKGSNSSLFKKFKSVYTMYNNKEYDNLVKYYSLSFELSENNT